VVRRPEHRSRGLSACALIALAVACACSAPAPGSSPAPAAAAASPRPQPPLVGEAAPPPRPEEPKASSSTHGDKVAAKTAKKAAKKKAKGVIVSEEPEIDRLLSGASRDGHGAFKGIAGPSLGAGGSGLTGSSGSGTLARAEEAPRLFPWPPPSPTARVAIDLSKVSPSAGGRTFGDIDGFLGAALSGAGYRDRAWYSVPGGFALVTRLEQVGDDGSPRPGDARWSTVPRFGSFSIRDYLRALLQATPGHFRVIAFVVTDQDFDSTPKPMTEELASEWAESGAPRLPASIAARPAGDRVFSVALIYEFARHRYDEQAEFLKGGDVPGADQLRRSGLAAMMLP